MDLNLMTILRVAAAAAAAIWGGLEPMAQLLVALMVMDIVTGFLASGSAGKLDSSVAFKGMLKKVLVLCLVGVGLLLEYYGQTAIPGLQGVQLPISEAIAGFFAASEGLSCVENAAAAGVPVPQFLRDALAKLSSTPTP